MNKTILPKPIDVYNDSTLYIYCPANSATGGPEALHQLGYHLNLLGFKAVMFYYDKQEGVSPVNPVYQIYNVSYVNFVEDKASNILITPESNLAPLFDKNIKNIRKVIWWLSVDNYKTVLQNHIKDKQHKNFFKLRLRVGHFNIPTIQTLKRKKAINIRHSYYSQHFLEQNGLKVAGKISDYMNATFFDSVDELAKKEDIIIYNKVKNGEFLDEIIRQTPDLNWKPLIGMATAEVAQWMNKSKLYIDFGYHPGKERMPREACIMRCCLIVGLDGSAKFDMDMPIDACYRFEKEEREIPAIIEQIKDCLANYEDNIVLFNDYRKVLYQEEEVFINDIKAIFKCL